MSEDISEKNVRRDVTMRKIYRTTKQFALWMMTRADLEEKRAKSFHLTVACNIHVDFELRMVALDWSKLSSKPPVFEYKSTVER